MQVKSSLIAALSLILAISAVSSIAEAKDKKKHSQRGMLESMQSVPCGAKERGLAGLGSVFGSVGVEHVNSHEQLCPQYILRTDEMDYHIRPMDMKHATVLPIGHEAEFKVKNDRLFLKVPDGDRKTRPYQVVAMQPVSLQKGDSAAYRPSNRPPESRPVEAHPANSDGNIDGNRVAGQTDGPPPPQPH